MKNREKAFWQMQNKCLTFCIAQEKSWKSYPVIATLVQLLESNNNQLITALKALENKSANPNHTNNDYALTQFSEKLYRLSRKLSLYAKMTGNELLLNEVDISENALYSYSEDKLLRMFSNILNLAKRHINNLSDYMISTEEVDALRLELNHLKHEYINKNQILNKRIATPRSVKELLIEARKLLDRLDDAFVGLINKPEFIKQWFEIRKINNPPVLKRTKSQIKTTTDNIDFNFYG